MDRETLKHFVAPKVLDNIMGNELLVGLLNSYKDLLNARVALDITGSGDLRYLQDGVSVIVTPLGRYDTAG